MFNECFLSNRSNCEYISHRVGRALVFFLPSVGFVSFFFFLKKTNKKQKNVPGRRFSLYLACVCVCVFPFSSYMLSLSFPFECTEGARNKIKLNFLLKMLLLLFRCCFGVFCVILIILHYQDGPQGN